MTGRCRWDSWRGWALDYAPWRWASQRGYEHHADAERYAGVRSHRTAPDVQGQVRQADGELPSFVKQPPARDLNEVFAAAFSPGQELLPHHELPRESGETRRQSWR